MGDGPVGSGITHSLACNMNGQDLLLSDPHYGLVRLDEDISVCQNCILRFYIETNHYENIWKLTPDHRYFYQLSALMDMFGPKDNYLIFNKIIGKPRSFKKYFR